MYPCPSAPAQFTSLCGVCDRTGVMLWDCGEVSMSSTVTSVWDASWRGSTFPTAQGLDSSALCIFTHGVSQWGKDTATLCHNYMSYRDSAGGHRLGWTLEYVLILLHDSQQIYSLENLPIPTFIIKIKQMQRNVLLGPRCSGYSFLSTIWLLRLQTLSKQKIPVQQNWKKNKQQNPPPKNNFFHSY